MSSSHSKSANATSREADRARTRAKVAAHRARQRKQGLRPVQLWVPDVRAAAFRKEAARQARLVATSAQEADDQAYIDAIAVALTD